jgi:dTDP-4-dehydrorhamnose reductase
VNVLVLGRKGLVGTHLVEALLRGRSVVAGLDIDDGGDVTNLAVLTGSVRDLMIRHSWKAVDWIVNLAAMTAVDACESDKERAKAANADGAGHAAMVAKEFGANLLQVSTDYVFDGANHVPYKETDPTNPLSEYGRTKLMGEERVRGVLPESRLLIVRGQSLYGNAPKSFPDAIVRMAREGRPVRVVTDQTVSPTWARDFAEGLDVLIRGDRRGLFHLSASGSCTWYEFARFVFEAWELDPRQLEPITTAQLGRPAPRPAWSVFDLSKYESAAGSVPRGWKDQLTAYRRTKGRAA